MTIKLTADEIVADIKARQTARKQDHGRPNGGDAAMPDIEPTTLPQVIAAFDKWLVLSNHTAIYAVLGTVAANLLPGDPVWTGLIASPSSAKTEILNALSKLTYAHLTATLTPASLLSGTPKKQRDRSAKGGLLREIGNFGVLVLKDFGSVLSMRPDAKAEILAALREIYDGAWTRHVGTDGGRTLSWKGKIGLVFGSTQVYDDHHSVIASLGDRFLLCRIERSASAGQLRMALKHTGASTHAMRNELATMVAGLFVRQIVEPSPLTDDELERLDAAISLAVQLRAHVSRDRYSREIESIHDAEGTPRIGIALERLFCGLVAIGLDRRQALWIIEDVALGSVPPIRRHAFEALTGQPQSTRRIAKALRLPTTTTRRALQDLEAHGLAIRTNAPDDEGDEKAGRADMWAFSPQWLGWPDYWASTR